MDFEARRDIAAPATTVYAAMTDFAAFERQALRRGAEVRRIDQANPATVGSGWDVVFMYRGRERRIQMTIAGMDPPHGLSLRGESQGLDFVGNIDLIALSRTQTRLTARLELQPKSLAAKLLVQSLKLARGNLTKRFEGRLDTFARDVEMRHSRGAKR